MSLRALGKENRERLKRYDRLSVLPEQYNDVICQLLAESFSSIEEDSSPKIESKEWYAVTEVSNNPQRFAAFLFSDQEPFFVRKTRSERTKGYGLVSKDDLLEAGIPLASLNRSANGEWNGVAGSIGVAEFGWMGLDLNAAGMVGESFYSSLTETLNGNLIQYSALDVSFNVLIPLIAFAGLLAWRKYKDGEIDTQALILAGQLFGKMAGAVLGWQMVCNLIAGYSYSLIAQAGLIGLGTAAGLTVLNFVTTLIGDYLDARREAKELGLSDANQSAYVREKMKESFKNFFSEDTARLAVAGFLAGAVWFLMAAAATAATAGAAPALVAAIYVAFAVMTGGINASIFKYVAQPTSSEAKKLTSQGLFATDSSDSKESTELPKQGKANERTPLLEGHANFGSAMNDSSSAVGDDGLDNGDFCQPSLAGGPA